MSEFIIIIIIIMSVTISLFIRDLFAVILLNYSVFFSPSITG